MKGAPVVLAVALALAASPAGAQSKGDERVYRLGVLSLTEPSHVRAVTPQELKKPGFAEGRNLVLDVRVGDSDRLPTLMRELLALGPPDAIIAIGTEPFRAAREATNTVPIVTFGTDAVAEGSPRASRARVAMSPAS